MNDDAVMQRALDLARRARGSTRPNPLVGAVIVRDGEIVGEGFHEQYGGAHAEVNALRAAGEAARGATMFVTLEPCAHHGRTPPCADAVIAAGISEVVIGASDPNALAAGGATRLREAGVSVRGPVLAGQSERLNTSFFHWHRHGTPFVTLKLAQSLDGAIARPGERTPLTGSLAWSETHRMRAEHDVILVGIATALTDDPLLTVRGVPTAAPPTRVVLDTQARLPLTSQLVRTAGEAPLLVITGADAGPDRVGALEHAGADVARIPLNTLRGSTGLDVTQVLTLLAGRGVRSVFVEGGAAVAASFLAAGLVNRMNLFIAPVVLGHRALRTFGDYSAERGWEIADIERLGRDVLITLERETP